MFYYAENTSIPYNQDAPIFIKYKRYKIYKICYLVQVHSTARHRQGSDVNVTGLLFYWVVVLLYNQCDSL